MQCLVTVPQSSVRYLLRKDKLDKVESRFCRDADENTPKDVIYADPQGNSYWWIAEYPCPPAIGWEIGMLTGYGIESFSVSTIAMWPKYNFVFVICE